MSGLDDLGRALRDDAAANAPRASAIDVDAVARAARARRRPRLIGVGALALASVVGIGGLAVGALAPPALIAASESADAPAVDAEPESLGAGEADGGGAPSTSDDLTRGDRAVCGAPVTDAPNDDPRLRLEVQLPSTVETGISQIDATSAAAANGVVRMINTSDAPQTVQTRSAASATLVRDGLVVGEGAIVADVGVWARLDPGVSLDLPISLITVSCTDGTPLPPGSYEVLVHVDAASDDGGTLTRLVALAGPIRVE